MLRFIPRQARPLDGRAAAALRPYEGVTARLLYARGITDAQQAEAFLSPSPDRLHDPMRMHGMAEALSILTDARRRGLGVAVYGDYDVDGICACALMTQALRRYGLRADPYTPLREAGWEMQTVDVVCCAAGRTRASGLQGPGNVKEKQRRVECIWRNPEALRRSRLKS